MSGLVFAVLLVIVAPPTQGEPDAEEPIALAGDGEAEPTLRKAEPPPPEDEIVVQARHRQTPGDPLEAINARTFKVMQKVDDQVVAPAAHAYDSLPEPVRNGLHNFLKNLNEPVVALNFAFQHKIGKAAETLSRFTINSVAGIGGLFDIARRKPIRLPRRPNGFADTLGFYGVKTGPYLFLPVIGPSTVRDLIGLLADRAVLPLVFGPPFSKLAFTVPLGAINVLDRRTQYDDELKAVRASGDSYSARRDIYLRGRQDEIDDLHRHHSAVHRSNSATPHE